MLFQNRQYRMLTGYTPKLMIIREKTDADLEQLRKLYLESRRKTFNWLPAEMFHLEEFDKDTAGEWILLAEENSKILGFSSVWLQDNFLHHLFVAPSEQGKGVGKKLLSSCFSQKLNRPATLKCVARNVRACKFYESLGWTIEAATNDGPMGKYYTYKID